MISRRGVTAGIASTALIGLAPPALGERRTGRLVPVRSTRLWVDESGPSDAPALLYVHGGPGVGALEFESYMKPAIAGRLRLISVDQRGVLRSDPLRNGAALTVADIIADFEALRETLQVPTWQVLGHSFGGMLAMRYALLHPQRVSRLSLENPAYDVAASSHWVAAAAAQALNGVAPAAAVEANLLADPATKVDPTFFDRLGPTMAALGEHRQDLYVVQQKNRDMFSRLARTAGLPEAKWAQGEVAGKALLRAPDFYSPMLARVRELRVPILYVRGAGDHTTSPAEIAGLIAAGARMITVANAGHFVHVEAPQALADLLAA